MRKVEEMIKEEGLWAGLNRPQISMGNADIVVFGIPFDGGVSFRAGAKDGPRELREITYSIYPITERWESFPDLKVLDLGDIEEKDREKIFKKAEEIAYQVAKAKKFLTMIGGDHSTTIPVLRGIDKVLDEPLGVIHLDAHFDLCDEIDGNYLSHGSTERRTLELKNISDIGNIFFAGVRSVEAQELSFIRDKKINILKAMDIRRQGVSKSLERIRGKMKKFPRIYLTIDIDVLDPAYAPGTGTPQFGGLDSRELLDLLYGIFELPIIGFDVVEVAPGLDDSKIAIFAARKIITECWGHYYRKKLSQ
ncbi:Guanidinobutyrase [subsurface metagenome]